MASTSRPILRWQPSFQMDSRPLPVTASVSVWEKGEGGRVAQSLVHSLLLPEDVHTFEDGMDKSLGRQLQWHTIVVTSCLSVPYRFLHNFVTFVIVFFCSTYYRLFYQAIQLTHILDGQLKELAEDAMWEKALKDVAKATSKGKTKAAATAEKKAVVSEKARVAAEKGSSELETKLGETELKLAEATSLNTTQVEKLADLALEACESKRYNKGFADAENSAEPVINEARKLAFEEG